MIFNRQNKFAILFVQLKKALSGEEQDYTTGSVRKAIFMLSVPMILEMMMESVFAVVDIFFVNRLGADAVSIVGLTESVNTIIYSVAIGMSAAATAVISRRIGEKNKEAAALTAVQVIALTILASLILSIPAALFSEDILHLMGAEPSAIASGSGYTRIMFSSSAVIMFLFVINGIYRGAGDASIAMRSLWIANICNIILDYLLIFGIGPFPELGIEGAAIATVIGRGIGVTYQLYHLAKGKGVVKIMKHHFNLSKKIIISLIEVASPATVQFLIASASWVVLAAFVAQSGSDASAGYQTGIRLVLFFILPAWGMSNAAATLVGQNLGAKQTARAEKSVLTTAKYNAVFMGSVSLIFLFFSHAIIELFTPAINVEQIQYAVLSLRIISAGYIFYGIGMVITMAFNGAGDTRTPTIINFFGFWTFQIPLAYLLSHTFSLGPTGVFIAIPVAETAIAIISFIIFKKGKWKTIKV